MGYVIPADLTGSADWLLRKVVNRELHVNKHAYDMTDNITRYDVSVKGWTVHGKTGTGSPGKNNQYDPHHAYGWYVGWATKGRKKLFCQTDSG